MRAVVGGVGMTTQRDTMVVFETSVPRAFPSGAAAGGLIGRSDVVYRRVTIGESARDSIRGRVVWTQRVPAPTDSGFTGPVMIPLSDTVRAGVLLVERRGDR